MLLTTKCKFVSFVIGVKTSSSFQLIIYCENGEFNQLSSRFRNMDAFSKRALNKYAYNTKQFCGKSYYNRQN